MRCVQRELWEQLVLLYCTKRNRKYIMVDCIYITIYCKIWLCLLFMMWCTVHKWLPWWSLIKPTSFIDIIIVFADSYSAAAPSQADASIISDNNWLNLADSICTFISLNLPHNTVYNTSICLSIILQYDIEDRQFAGNLSKTDWW